MNIVDLLVTIVVVTILVTIILAVVTYVAYKLRLAREPAAAQQESGPQYFVLHPPPALVDGAEDRATQGPASGGATPTAVSSETHAPEA